MRHLIIAFCLMLAAQLPLAATIHVPADRPTIQAGINAAVNGDIVLVAPGTYNEQFIFGGKTIVVRSTGGPAVTKVLGSTINDENHPTVLMEAGVGSGAILEGFTFQGGPIAIKVYGSPTIRRNVLTDQTYGSWAALVVSGPARIINNTICNGANGGLACYAFQAIVKNNIIAYNNSYGVYEMCVLTYNDVYGNGVDYAEGAEPGTGSLSVDPGFVNEAARDYHLSIPSPCINAGDPDAQFVDPDGSRNDMGAYFLSLSPPCAVDINYGSESFGEYVFTLEPRIYWSYFDTAVTQPAGYEIEVGSDNHWQVAEMWATGQVLSSDTSVLYAGNPLIDNSSYYLRLRVYSGVRWGEWTEKGLITHTMRVINVPAVWSTIQAGIDAAVDGDTVLVAPGIYTENLDFSGRSIKVIGSEGAPSTTIMPASPDSVNIRFTDRENANTELAGFTIKGGLNIQVLIDGSANPVISRNIFIDYVGSDCNIRVRSANALIKYNLFYGNEGESCIGTYQGLFTALNNTMDGNARGLHSLSGGVVKNNIVTNSRDYGIWGLFDEWDYNDAWNNGSDNYPGPHGISADPSFTNPGVNDFTLSALSPCIDAGDPDPQYNDPDGTRNDIGAFPYWLGSLPPLLDPIGPRIVAEADTLLFAVTATDPDGIIVSIIADPIPNGAGFIDSGNGRGAFGWIPDYTQAGIYAVTFTATDDSGKTDFEIVPISVTNTNRPPTLDPITDRQLFEGEHIEIVVTASDPDNTPLVLSAPEIPPNADFEDSANGHGLFQFDPDFNQSGIYPAVTFIASDGGLADTVIVTITVKDANPVVTSTFVDGDNTPTNVVNNTPAIAWTYGDPTGAHPQTQAEIAVGTDNDWTYAEMWNPAPFPGPGASRVYAGAALADGATYYARLRVYNGLAWSDWHEISFRMNTAPTIPVLSSPIADGLTATVTPMLYLHNSADPETDTLTYDFKVMPDTDYVLTVVNGIPQNPDSTGWMVDVALDEDARYFWAARAWDGFEYSAWSPPASFWVNASEQSPTAFDLYYPPDTEWSQVYDFPTHFQWGQSSDPDPLDSVYFRLQVGLDSDFTFVATYDSIYATTYDVSGLDYGTHYWWKVYAHDTRGHVTRSNGIADFMTWVLGDANADSSVNVGDVVFLINAVFKGSTRPDPMKAGDVNGDCATNVGDAVYLINFIFRGGDPPRVGCVLPPQK